MNGAKRGRGLQPVGKTGASNQKNEFLARIDVNEVE
jgi:hypothetical protein